MYAIIVYDVSADRVTKVWHFLRQYLDWMQNSVFEGELTISELKQVETRLKELIDESTDCVQIYTTRNKALIKKNVLGRPKAEPRTVIWTVVALYKQKH